MYSAIITAAGKGARMNTDLPKQYIKLGGLPLLCHSILAFDSIKEISELIIVIPTSDKDFFQNHIIPFSKTKSNIKIAFGGKERQNSVYNGLLEVKNKNGIVLIHDAARPFITKDMIYMCIKKAEEKKAAILAIPATDTLKILGDENVIRKTIKREKIWLAQTPQVFFYPLILKAHIKAREEGIYKTDDAALLEYLNEKVYVVQGSRFNIKITTNEDFIWANSYISLKKVI